MSTDCLREYYGRASWDILQVWSGWASTVIHGQCYEPDLGPRYATGLGPRYALGCGRRYVPDRGPRNCRTNLSATSPLDLRARKMAIRVTGAFMGLVPLTGPVDRRRRYISMDIEAPLLLRRPRANGCGSKQVQAGSAVRVVRSSGV